MKGSSPILVPLFFTTSALALDARDASYYCASEFSGGLYYDKGMHRWQPTIFHPSSNFVLKLKFMRTRTRKDALDKEEVVNDYIVTVTPAGEHFPSPCAPHEGSDYVSFGDWDAFRCGQYVNEYYFSLKTNRFLDAYMAGYVEGRDSNDGTPAMSGGTCTKIE